LGIFGIIGIVLGVIGGIAYFAFVWHCISKSEKKQKEKEE